MKNKPFIAKRCEEDCNGSKNYSDGFLGYCLCEARAINTICGANVTHNKTSHRPVKIIAITLEGTKNDK